MKLHHFRDVVAIAEQGSLRAAARHLHVAQPTLTRSVAELERELGAPLFDRRKRGMIVTAIGQSFVERARAILNEVRRASEEVQQLIDKGTGTVVVGLSIAPHLAMLPDALPPFRKRYPKVQLHIIEGFYPTLEGGLRDGSLDFYVGPKPESALPDDLMLEELFTNTRTILCRKGHPLSRARSLSELTGAEWVTTSITLNAEEELNRPFEEEGLPLPRLMMRTQSALSLIVSLTCTDLLAMAPIQWMSYLPTADSLGTIRIKEGLPAPTITLIRRSQTPLTPAALYFADLMRRSAAKFG